METITCIDELWKVVEGNSWLLSDVGTPARSLNYLDTDYDIQFQSGNNFETSFRSPENNYWMRNGTFALLILAAEGEI